MATLNIHDVVYVERGETFVVPIPVEGRGYFLIDIQVDEEAGDALLDASVYRAPRGRGEAVAWPN